MSGGMAAMPTGLRVPAAGTYLVVAALGSVNGPGNALVTGTVGLLVQRGHRSAEHYSAKPFYQWHVSVHDRGEHGAAWG